MNMQLRTILLGLLSIGFVQGYAQTFALQVKNEGITYLNDERGNRILDFSYCGYHASGQDIPSVGNAVFVPWKAGDNTARIQRAIDYVASLPPILPVSVEPYCWIVENSAYPGNFVFPCPALFCVVWIEKNYSAKERCRQRSTYLYGRNR